MTRKKAPPPDVAAETGAERKEAAPIVPYDRRQSIGSSEIAAIVGVHPNRTAYDVWLEKTGKVAPWEGNEKTFWGSKLERSIVERYVETAPRPLTGIVEQMFNVPLLHPTLPFHASPDALAKPLELVIEAKNVEARESRAEGWRWGDPNTDEVPIAHLCQGMWLMMVTGYVVVDWAVLFAGCNLQRFTAYRDEGVISQLQEEALRFWEQNVVADVPPKVEDSETLRRWMRKRFAVESEPLRLPTDEEVALLAEYADFRAQRERFEKEEGDRKLKLELAIGDAQGIEIPGVMRATWKAPKASSKIDWEGYAKFMESIHGRKQSELDRYTTVVQLSRRFLFKDER